MTEPHATASTLHAMPSARDTVVFIPAWNEEANLPAVLDELRCEAAGRGRAGDRRRLDRRDCHGRASRTAPTSSPSARTAGSAPGSRPDTARRPTRGYAYCGRVDADGQHPADELARLLELVRSGRCDVAVGSRFAAGDGYDAGRYEPSPARRFGIGLLQKAMHVRLGRPFHDPTSGMAAVNAEAMRVMARPYVSGAPEVEALLRLREAGLRVEEVAVHMRERQSGESKLQGMKAVKLVLTVVGTLVFFGWLRRRRG